MNALRSDQRAHIWAMDEIIIKFDGAIIIRFTISLLLCMNLFHNIMDR